MIDNGPDIAFEIKRKEYQRLTIRINVLDQRAQLEDFIEERKSLKALVKELAAEPTPDVAEDATPAERLRAQKAELVHEQTLLAQDVRLAELDGIEARYRVNIEASDGALEELDRDIAGMKEALNG